MMLHLVLFVRPLLVSSGLVFVSFRFVLFRQVCLLFFFVLVMTTGTPQVLSLCGRGARSSLRVLRHGLAVSEMAVSPLPGTKTIHFCVAVVAFVVAVVALCRLMPFRVIRGCLFQFHLFLLPPLLIFSGVTLLLSFFFSFL